VEPFSGWAAAMPDAHCLAAGGLERFTRAGDLAGKRAILRSSGGKGEAAILLSPDTTPARHDWYECCVGFRVCSVET